LSARFYDPQHGAVRIDGHDIRDLTLASLGRVTGMVLQDTYLFHGTLRDNLLYARPDATASDLEDACAHAQLHDVVAALPSGLDTVVGERGHRLSGGEKQRVAIARVILQDPRLLVLDEATSHLDTVSEQRVQAALTQLFTDRTSLVIAHRLSTVLAADVIVLLDQGRVVGRGTHAELLASDGLYRALYETQFRPDPAPRAPVLLGR
jgi:ATP-binding cassette subfamily B protein